MQSSRGDHVSFHDSTGFDGLVQAAALAALSRRVTVWTAVYLLALRHAVPVARQIVHVSGWPRGRFVFGLGGEVPLYKTSFSRFERCTRAGTPADVAAAIARSSNSASATSSSTPLRRRGGSGAPR